MTNDEIRSRCQQLRKERQDRHPEDRETLLPCPCCGGSGMIGQECGASYYRRAICPYCDGEGHTFRDLIKLYRDNNPGT
jgi:DnaJ-class molecular chaperone